MRIFGFDEAASLAVIGKSGSAALVARHSAITSAFRDGIRRLGWTLIDCAGDRVAPGRSRRFVLGVALWSWPDLAALEDLANVDWIRDQGIPVEVFDFDSCLTIDDLSALVPGIPPITQTPLLAEYEGNRLRDYRIGPTVSIWCREFSRHEPYPSVGKVTPRPLGGSSRRGSTA